MTSGADGGGGGNGYIHVDPTFNSISSSCKDITVQLDGNGQASIKADSVLNGFSGSCSSGIAWYSLDAVDPFEELAFEVITGDPNLSYNWNLTCADVGSRLVRLRATDSNLHYTECNATITVLSGINSDYCKNPTVQLGSDGQYTLTEADVFDASGTNLCGNNVNGIFGGIDQDSVNCFDIGSTTVNVTVLDPTSNQPIGTCQSILTVQDNTPPCHFWK